MSDWLWRANVNNSVLHAVYSFCLLQWTIPLNSVSKWLFFLIFLDIQVFVGSVKVLEKFLWGPGKSWKSPGFFSVKEWEPWRKVLVIEDQLTSVRPRTCKSLKFSRPLHSADTVWQLRLRCTWITMKKSRNFSYESDRRRNLLICTNCLRTSFVFQVPQDQWIASSAQVDIHATTPCTFGQQAIKLKWIGDDKK